MPLISDDTSNVLLSRAVPYFYGLRIIERSAWAANARQHRLDFARNLEPSLEEHYVEGKSRSGIHRPLVAAVKTLHAKRERCASQCTYCALEACPLNGDLSVLSLGSIRGYINGIGVASSIGLHPSSCLDL